MSHDEEFDDFVRAAWPRLRQAAYTLTGNTESAEDLLQGVLIRTYSRWSRIRRDDPVAYVRRALVNAWIDVWRRRRRLVEEPTEWVPETAVADDYAALDRVDLHARLASLTDRERTMLVMRHYFDLPESQVAASLGCSVGTVKSTCSRALQALRIPATTSPRSDA